MPTKRRFSITASEEDVVPVIASYVPNKRGRIPNTHLAYLSCKSCNTEVLGSNTISPFCFSCSSEMRSTSDKTLEVTSSEINNEFHQIGKCTSCGTILAQRTDIQASFDDGFVYCPTCTEKVTIADSSEEDEDESNLEDDNSDDMSETVDNDSNSEDDNTLFDNEAGEGDGDSSSSEDNSDSNDSSDNNSSDNTEAKTKDTSNNNSTDNSDSTDNKSSGSTLNANLVQALAGKSGSISVVASPDKSKWFLFLDNTPVASATKDNASENVKGFFDSDKFASSWNAATSDGVTEDLLNDFGFTANTVDVTVDEAVKQNLEASIAEERKKISVTAAEVRSRFERCFGIAAVGINKQVFVQDNPVKIALVASLKNRNVRDAERIVTAAFNEYGEEMLANVAEKASELMEKSDETLDDLAKTVDEAKNSKSEETIEKKPAPKLTTFPKKEEDRPNDEVKETYNSENNSHKMAASDLDNDELFNKIARRMRRF